MRSRGPGTPGATEHTSIGSFRRTRTRLNDPAFPFLTPGALRSHDKGRGQGDSRWLRTRLEYATAAAAAAASVDFYVAAASAALAATTKAVKRSARRQMRYPAWTTEDLEYLLRRRRRLTNEEAVALGIRPGDCGGGK